MTRTATEHAHEYRRNYDLETRELIEDIDTWWLADRPSRLSRWHVR